MASPKKAVDSTKFAEESKQISAEELAARTYMADEAAWENDGEEFGGQSDILLIQVGEVAGPFTYVGFQNMTTNLGDTTVHLGIGVDEETHRLPIQATFQRAVDQAGLKRGDKFLVRRFEDQIKKQGKGKGNPMAIYAVKVTERAPVAAAPLAAK